MRTIIIIFCFIYGSCVGQNERRFPENFVFGVSTAAYQIEGGWNEDGKSENIWDYLTHNTPEAVIDHSNGDIAADSYHNYKRDVEMMRELGVDVYRFSLSWARILPTGFTNQINEAGITYYNNLIDEMLKYDIIPMVTLYHWDLPQMLQELGGFENPLIANWFEDYARVAFQYFGDRVKLWITFNEPKEICVDGYGSVGKAPMLNATGIGEYICAKNLVLAHAKAYHAYLNDFKASQQGQCGISFSISSCLPLTDSVEDQFTYKLQNEAEWGIYADPIFSSEGGFPKDLSEKIAMKSKQQGFPRSRLPEYTDEEKTYVRGTSDFLGVNHYGGSLVSAAASTNYAVPSLSDDVGASYQVPDDWPKSVSSWLTQMPNSLYLTLTRLSEKYGNPNIYVTENGWSTNEGLEDDDRVNYLRAAWESALDALDDGINLKGYMAWSLMDNFEWLRGYKERFGLYEVDFEDPARTRTPRKSAFVYKHLIKTRSVDHDYEPENYVMTIDEAY